MGDEADYQVNQMIDRHINVERSLERMEGTRRMSQTVGNLTNLFTPGGRFVSGDLDRKQDKDYENKPIPPEEQEYYFAVAVPKNQPGVDELLGQLHGLAAQAYGQAPQLLAQVNMGLKATGFSWKIEDGDVVKIDQSTGQPKKIPEYIAGCYIFKFRTKYEFGACDLNGTNINRADIKRGDYVDVMFTAAPNGRYDGNAGIILYPNAIRRLGYGEAISGAVDASTAFSGHAANVPPGATAAPTAGGATPPAQGQMGNGMPAATQQGHQYAQGAGAAMGQNTMASAPPVGGQQPMMQGNAPQGDPMMQGNPAGGGMPPAGGQPAMDAGGAAQTGMGQPPQTGGMPPASSGMATTSHGDPAAMGVQPYNQILHGPQGGGMPGA